MGKKLLRNLFVKNSALITSWASVAIAITALGLGIYSAWLDRTYKEISLRPALTASIQSADFSFSIYNAGLGPAQIRTIATKFNGSCKYFNNYGSPDREKIINEMVHDIGDYFVAELRPLIQGSIWDPVAPKVRVQILTPRQIIAAGEHITLFQFVRDQENLIQERLQKMNTQEANKITQDFDHLAIALPFYPEYCSLTGYFCRGERRINENCR